MAINIDREALEKLAAEANTNLTHLRCFECGCFLSLGAVDNGYGDFSEVLYCEGNCGYEETL